jgi:hypothetical protein
VLQWTLEACVSARELPLAVLARVARGVRVPLRARLLAVRVVTPERCSANALMALPTTKAEIAYAASLISFIVCSFKNP